MNCKDLSNLRQAAIASFRAIPVTARLDGCLKSLTAEDLRLISVYEATLQLLNSKGALKEGWLDANPIQYLTDDSNPGEEDYT